MNNNIMYSLALGFGSLCGILGASSNMPENPDMPSSPYSDSSILGDSDMSSDDEAGKNKKKVYTCPMHPEVEQDHPGTCSKCGTSLVPKQ